MNEVLINSVLRLDRWLESMRGPGGYTGPVSHWWDASFIYCGPMCDWRYEGIICGYVELARKLPGPWIDRAKRAARDVMSSQLADGTFSRSSFQIGPVEGGTPHEAAVDVGLFSLAANLSSVPGADVTRLLEAAVRNIEQYHLGSLWDGTGFTDQPRSKTKVANKNATTIEALVGYAHATSEPVESFIEGAVDVIDSSIVRERGMRYGGTVHLGTGPYRLVIPYYTARCLSALATLYEWNPEPRYRSLGLLMTEFLVTTFNRHGFAFGFTANGTVIANPRWIAAAGDILRALIVAERVWSPGIGEVIKRIATQLIDRQRPSGSWSTADGMSRRGLSRPYIGTPSFRDVVPVVGWNDKVLRALALLIEPDLSHDAGAGVKVHPVMEQCTWMGSVCEFEENDRQLLMRRPDGTTLFEWRKGSLYPCQYQL